MTEATKTIGAFDAKTHLSQYLDEVAQGACIEITRRGKRVAYLVSPERLTASEPDLRGLIHSVKERRATYSVDENDIDDWKQEGRKP